MELPAQQWMLRDHNYHRSKTSFEKLPPTSHAITVHIIRPYYATSIISANTTELNPFLYGFEEEDEPLHPDNAIRPIPKEYAVDCSEIAPFIKDDVFVTKELILLQCISCDRDMFWQPLTASKHSQVVQAACNSRFSSGGSDFKQSPISMTF